MRFRNYLGLLPVFILFISCGDDGERAPDGIAFRDRGEQSIADDIFIREYLETHFYNYEEFANPPANFDYEIRFDTIAGANEDKTPMIDQITTKTYDRFGTSNTLYILTAREGSGTTSPSIADSTFINFKGVNILSNVFDAAVNPVWFNLPATIDGFANGIAGARGSLAGPTISSDGVTEYPQDYGIGAIFIPSGLGFFAQPPSNDIGIYSSLVFTFSLFESRVTDHDGDGIISINEDIDGNGFLFDALDNTDGDVLANFTDADDDNDGINTRLETMTDDDGNFLGLIDTDNDGIMNHLDDDDDGDGIDTSDEIIVNFTTGDITFPDTDNDGIPDYLDADSW